MEQSLEKIKKFIGLFGPKKSKETCPDRRYNEKIFNELCKHFRAVLEEESFVDTMIYPTYFKVVMTSEDYQTRMPMFRVIVPRVIQEFYSIIRECQHRYPSLPLRPRFWVFQFLRTHSSEFELAGNRLEIVSGKIVTIAEVEAPGDSGLMPVNTGRFSIRIGDSVTHHQNSNLDWSRVTGLEVISEGEFRYRFDERMVGDIVQIESSAVNGDREKLAELVYTASAGNYVHDVCDEYTHVSGKNDSRMGIAIFRIPDSNLPDSSLQIKHLGNKRFQVAAFVDAMLNEVPMRKSTGGTIYWEMLPNNSKILLDGYVSLKFKTVV